MSNAPTSRRFRIKNPHGRQLRPSPTHWGLLIPSSWLNTLKHAVQSITYHWIASAHVLISSEIMASDKDNHRLEYEIHVLWSRWKTFERTIKASHAEVLDSPVYFNFGHSLSLMKAKPGKHTAFWAVREKCRGIAIDMEKVKSCLEEVVMRLVDFEKNESDEHGDPLVSIPQYQIPTLSGEIYEFLDAVESSATPSYALDTNPESWADLGGVYSD